MVIDHFQALRNDERTHNSYIKVFWEANSAWSGVDAARRLIKNPENKVANANMISFHSTDRKANKPGVWTDTEEKLIGADRLQEALMRNRLCYASGFSTGTESSPALMRKKIEEQLQQYRHEIKVPDDGGALGTKIKHHWSGKGPGGRRDDLCWSIQMCLYWSSVLLRDNRFVEFVHANGWRAS
jgi:hypothetical protein